MADTPGPAGQGRPEEIDLDAAIHLASVWDGVSELVEDDEPLDDILAATDRGFQVETGTPYDPADLIRRTPGLADAIARQLQEPRVRRGWKPRRPR